MKASYLVTILAYNLIVTSLCGADTFIASTRNFPKFDKLPAISGYKYGYPFDDTNKAIVPSEFKKMATNTPINDGKALSFFPPFIAHYCTTYPNSHSSNEWLTRVKSLLQDDQPSVYPICSFIYIAQEICTLASASPQTSNNVLAACLQILTGHGIDLSDRRLTFDATQEKLNKHTLILYLPSPLKEIITEPFLLNETKYTDETNKFIDAVFKSCCLNQQFSHEYKPNIFFYDLNQTVSNSIFKHNNECGKLHDSREKKSTLWYVSPQSTLRIAQDLWNLIVNKNMVTGHQYNKQEEITHFAQLAQQFPKTLKATDANITREPYLSLAFEACKLQEPQHKDALSRSTAWWYSDRAIRRDILTIFKELNIQDED